MNVHAMCMYRVTVYTFVHDFSTAAQVSLVYDRVRYVYYSCYSVHDHTRFPKLAQLCNGVHGVSAKFFLEGLTQRENRI